MFSFILNDMVSALPFLHDQLYSMSSCLKAPTEHLVHSSIIYMVYSINAQKYV